MGDETGQSINAWDPDSWQEMWPSCPDGNPQRLCHPLGFRERSIGELELRVALGGDDRGVCDIVMEHGEDEVRVRVLVCYDDEDEELPPRNRGYMDCPVRVWLDQPLGDQAVIDLDTDEELPLFVPEYLNKRGAARQRVSPGSATAAPPKVH
jgi:hypothetical protein